MATTAKYNIWLLLFEKLLLGVTVTILTATLLYFYNVYSKAFEIAQSQSRAYSGISVQLRDLALTSTIKTTQDIRISYNDNAETLPLEKAKLVETLAVELEKTSRLVKDALPQTAPIAVSMARKMREAVVGFESGLNFNARQIGQFETEIADLQTEFLKSFNSEIGSLAISEFKAFKDQFDDALPWFVSPFLLSTIFVVVLLICSVLMWRLANREDQNSPGS